MVKLTTRMDNIDKYCRVGETYNKFGQVLVGFIGVAQTDLNDPNDPNSIFKTDDSFEMYDEAICAAQYLVINPTKVWAEGIWKDAI